MHCFKAAYQLNIPRLCKRLHIDGDGPVDIASREMLPGLEALAKENMGLSLWYREGHFVTGIPEVDDCEMQIVCLVSSSRKLEELLGQMAQRGDYLEGYLLNDLSNELLFQASNQLNRHLSEKYEAEGRFLTEKIFPGQGGVPLNRQDTLLRIMKEKEALPVEINDSFMLLPEKSMLYAFGADAKNEKRPWEHDCSWCDRVDCMFRSSDGENCPK